MFFAKPILASADKDKLHIHLSALKNDRFTISFRKTKSCVAAGHNGGIVYSKRCPKISFFDIILHARANQ